jgi:hypothetical protein
MSIREIFKPLDGVLILLIVAVALFWSRSGRAQRTTAESLLIVTSVSVDTVSLQRDTTIVLEHLTIDVRNRSAAIVNSDCPSQYCVQTGYISEPGQMLACMPNKVWIEILGTNQAVDAVSY